MIFGGKFTVEQSLKMKVIDSTYKDQNDIQEHIKKFAQEYAPKGAFREALSDIKKNVHYELSRIL